MKAKDYIGMKFEEAEDKVGSLKLEQDMELLELNTCCKCSLIELSNDLFWIVEGFNPPHKLSEAFYEEWGDSALCLECYLNEAIN